MLLGISLDNFSDWEGRLAASLSGEFCFYMAVRIRITVGLSLGSFAPFRP